MMIWEKMEKAARLYHSRQKEREQENQKVWGDDGRRLEKGDLPAMLLSAFLVILPAVLLLLLFIVGLAYFLLLH